MIYRLQDAKKSLRDEIRLWLKDLELESKREWNKKISIKLKKLTEQLLRLENSNQKQLLIGGYFPMSDEADWLIEFMTYPNLCFPQVDIKSRKIRFYQSRVQDLKKIKLFGKELCVPDDFGKEVFPDILVVPGLGFSAAGERLGRGGGFYDQYLKSFNGAKIGICYEGQLRKHLPVESHDQAVSVIITEKQVLRY
jgi:5-formyltetrahydrofolate cyclo-ligase